MLMDAIQRCLMFEDRDETARQGRAVAEWLRIPPGGGGPVVVLSSHCEGILDFSSRRGRQFWVEDGLLIRKRKGAPIVCTEAWRF
uniref:Uncharacterized protein n=1 Tax=Fagus sylvatica TaxID=28930 RepID=A0A2N9EN25_FAGSY